MVKIIDNRNAKGHRGQPKLALPSKFADPPECFGCLYGVRRADGLPLACVHVQSAFEDKFHSAWWMRQEGQLCGPGMVLRMQVDKLIEGE